MGVPVVLVYLGFRCAKDVRNLGEPFADFPDWPCVVLEYSRNIVPERAWERELKIGAVTIKPLLRVWEQEIPAQTLSRAEAFPSEI